MFTYIYIYIRIFISKLIYISFKQNPKTLQQSFPNLTKPSQHPPKIVSQTSQHLPKDPLKPPLKYARPLIVVRIFEFYTKTWLQKLRSTA